MNAAFLRRIAKAKGKAQRKRILQRASKPELNAVRNLCYNVCHGHFKLPSKVCKKLIPYRKDIRDLANKKKLKTKRALSKRLIHKGGFLPALIPAVLGILSSLTGRAIGRAIGV